MKYRHLGNSGLEVSEIGIGTNNFGGRLEYQQSEVVVHAALDQGITLFDTADTYSHGQSEQHIGRALKGRRDQAVIATKAGMKWADGPHGVGASRKRILDGAEASLRRLQTDYIDLFQVHRQDTATPIEETLGALDSLVRDGKVRYVGCSNYDSWRIVEAMWTSRTSHLTPYVSCQPEYSLVVRDIERDILPACESYGLGILPYFPLAMGFLTGKYRRGEPVPEGVRLALAPQAQPRRLTDANFDKLDKYEAFSKKHSRTVVELAFAWLLARKSVSSVIAGASNTAQVQQNAAACEWVLTPEEAAEVSSY